MASKQKEPSLPCLQISLGKKRFKIEFVPTKTVYNTTSQRRTHTNDATEKNVDQNYEDQAEYADDLDTCAPKYWPNCCRHHQMKRHN